MTAHEALKPCPFCGSTDLKKRRDDGLFWIRCHACGATGPENTKYAEEDEPHWNRRAEAPSVEARRISQMTTKAEAMSVALSSASERIERLALEALNQQQEIRDLRLALQQAKAASTLPPDGYVIAPHYRGYAHLGTGNYLVNHTAEDNPAEIVISIATDEEKAGRTVGDERDNIPGALIQADVMCVRIRFENVAGLDVLEKQLRYLREFHFHSNPASTDSEDGAVLDKDGLQREKTGGAA